MSVQGYYRYPTICKDNVVFVSEDDLWTVDVKGGVARRLTANLATILFPCLSPDGKTIAFSGREEGNPEVYTMPVEGGPVTRVTYLGVSANVLGWAPDGKKILFSSNFSQALGSFIYAVDPKGGLPEQVPVGMAVSISCGPNGKTVIGRNNNDPARWKRYRGGTAGDLWVDDKGKGQFKRLITLKGNLARPMWIGDRIYFISDHEGVGNIYSCTPSGTDLKRHTNHTDYYTRFPSTDGSRIVYHAGADLYVFDTLTGKDTKIEVQYHSPHVHRQRKYVDTAKYLESVSLHPKGHSLAITTRGKSFTFGNWEGPVYQQNTDADALIRTRLTQFLNDGERVVTVTDVDGVDMLEIHDSKAVTPQIRIENLDLGRVRELDVAPKSDEVLVSNHRNELILVDLCEKTATLLDKSPVTNIEECAWSPDGEWVAYSFAPNTYVSEIRLWCRKTGETHSITEPILHDRNPAWDPEGKYLYFLGEREFNPVYDGLHFDLGFPKGTRPYLITLQADEPTPFIPRVRELSEEQKKDVEEPKNESKDDNESKAIKIDLEGITQRIVAFPVPEGRYNGLKAIKNKALWAWIPVEGALAPFGDKSYGEPKQVLQAYDFKDLELSDIVSGISGFRLSRDGKTLLYRVKERIRVVAAGPKVDDSQKTGGPGRKSGWVDLSRVKVSVEPTKEWRQMAREVWRLQTEYFWTPDMSKVDWNKIWKRYYPLIERVGTRGEFSDLMWEMQAELATSHCYEMGGDYRTEPSYPMGTLGANLSYDSKKKAYRIDRILRGTPGEPKFNSPLAEPGIQIKEGDLIKAVNGRPVSAVVTPYTLLVNLADTEVGLTIESNGDTRVVNIKTLPFDSLLRYREWVEENRRYVHEKSKGKVGYVHIPDMGARGYAEFHRRYLAEVAYDSMIVDVRFNGGGHVSQLILEKLARRRIGFDLTRWGEPEPYPSFSVGGPMVAVTNQFAGSDGDIFSHAWKLMKLGTLIGKRTWGGVIGIWPRNVLADGSMTSQPEFSFWFKDVGWGVENYGTDPDIEIDMTPQDYVAGRDPQLDKAIEVVLDQLKTNPPLHPDFSKKPSNKLPDKLG
jgi:tricorn protease